MKGVKESFKCDSRKFQNKSAKGVSSLFKWSFVLQFCSCMDLLAVTQAEGGLVLKIDQNFARNWLLPSSETKEHNPKSEIKKKLNEIVYSQSQVPPPPLGKFSQIFSYKNSDASPNKICWYILTKYYHFLHPLCGEVTLNIIRNIPPGGAFTLEYNWHNWSKFRSKFVLTCKNFINIG